jgi:hypothetical protein
LSYIRHPRVSSIRKIYTMAETTAAPSGAHSRSGSVYASKFKLPEHFYGGNSLDAAAPSKVKDFVAANDGHTVITKVGSLSRVHQSAETLPRIAPPPQP